ncbi:MAG: hypothetical protein ACFFHV_22660 [Promethearchaeota archaeon]
MTMKERIIEILKRNRYTIKDIYQNIKKSYNIEIRVSVYINRLKEEDIVERCGIDIRYKIYKLKHESFNASDPITLLKELYGLMSRKINFIKNQDNNDIEIIKTVKGMI